MKLERLNYNESKNMNPIFVYGTLMKGQRNYDYYLKPAEPAFKGEIEGFQMFDLGSFPGIVAGEGKIKGEVYFVSDSQLAAIDILEGAGNLYLKQRVSVKLDGGDSIRATVYVFNRSVAGYKKIPYEDQPYGRRKKVWYVSYGSNLLKERLACYVEGGTCRFNETHYDGCRNKKMPEESRPVIIPYNMYYGNESRSWSGSAVSFLDVSHSGFSYGRAWLVDEDQLEGLHRQEGKGKGWYHDAIRLEDIEGLPAYTFTNKVNRQSVGFEKVSHDYAFVLFKGMKETYPDLTDDEIYEYLKRCGTMEENRLR